MPSFAEAFRTNSPQELSSAKGGVSGFPQKLGSYRDRVVQSYIRFGSELNGEIAKIASAEGLNDDQIQRVVEEVNNQVYLTKYAQVKSCDDRDIKFPVAMLKDVKKIIGGDSETEKKASAEDPLNAFNFTSHEFGNCAPEKKKELIDIVAEKIASDHSQATTEIDKASAVFDASISKIAEAMIKFDRAGVDAQRLFNIVCRDAYLGSVPQNVIKLAITEQVNMLKEAGTVNQDYELSLENYDANQESDDFGLGKFSLMKTASNNGLRDIPSVLLSDGTFIKNIPAFVKIASEVMPEKIKLDELHEKLASIESRLTKKEDKDDE